jgi:penicillin V acylase-like amidase (Ntn superfamily)
MQKQIQLSKLCLFLFLLIVSNTGFCCSAFLMKGENFCIIGFNENWKTMPGMVVINKKGIVKKNLSWNYLISENKPNDPEIEWTSKYGSVSFNLFGLDLPCYGINEKGLFIVELYLDKTYSLQDSTKPNMFFAQWIQFQLDNYATVNEVIDGLKNTPVIDWWPTFPGSHFFVSDREGNTAAIELINGVFQVSSGEKMPVPVLCNAPYQNELKNMQNFKPFGGNEILNLNFRTWNNRFSKAAYYIKNYNANTNIKPVNYAWNVLDSIKPGQWQMVADLRNNMVYFRSDIGKDIKSIDISKCDFSKTSTVQYFDINKNVQGNVTYQLSDLTVEINDEYVMKGFPVGYDNAGFYNSDKYACLKKTLHHYAFDKLKQTVHPE